MDARPTPPPPTREHAVAAAGVYCHAMDTQDQNYLIPDLMRDAGIMARHLIAAAKDKAIPAPTPPPPPGDKRPVDSAVLKEAGFVQATDNGVNWGIEAADGRELVYSLAVVSDGLAAVPTFRLIDEDGDGASLPVPRSAGELADTMRVLRFVRV